jgi:hypothetical protein
MTEAEWLAAGNPRWVLEQVRAAGGASDRKLRLFACACCREPSVFRFWDAPDEAAVAAAERFAEGQADLAQLQRARQRATRMGPAWCCAERAAGAAGAWVDCADPGRGGGPERRTLFAALLRDVFPRPSRRAAIDPAWLRWGGGTVAGLARAAYEEPLAHGRLDPVRLAVLADALEEADCSDAELLSHLRGGGPHVRGCWPVDALLGRQ